MLPTYQMPDSDYVTGRAMLMAGLFTGSIAVDD
jgi:hypothetical protein